MIMEKIARFLHSHPPFDQLPWEIVQRVAQTIRSKTFAAGQDILTVNGDPAQFLYIVATGRVDLLRETETDALIYDTLGEGEAFGYPSLIRQSSPMVTVRAQQETLTYLLPAEEFHRLRHNWPSFAQFFSVSAIERLNYALGSVQSEAAPTLFQTHLRDLAHRSLVTIDPDATVREAAQMMNVHNVSCLIVQSDPVGIITDRDLRNRVLAVGLSDMTPVREVMTPSALMLPADSLVFEGLIFLFEHSFHHLPITEEDEVVGLVTHTDILRQQSRSPLFLPYQLQRARTIDDLHAYTEQVMLTVGALLDSGARVHDIGRVVAVAHDALLIRLLKNAEADLGPLPCPYAWLVMGSEGRYEQTLRTDQDNALVYADNAPSEAETYFARFADQVVEQLVICGFPRCPGDIMATNPQWRQPISVWKDYFSTWINRPDEEALLRVGIFFDFRRVYGELDAEKWLRPVIKQARHQRIFLARMARAALRQRAPFGFFHQIQLERQGERRDLIDLKQRGTALIVDLARLFALEAGCASTNTQARLRLAAPHSSLSQAGSEELIAAYELINLLRLRHQYRQIRHHDQPTNYVALSELSGLERRDLKESLLAIERAQRGAENTFHTSHIG